MSNEDRTGDGGVVVETDGAVVVLRLARAERRNAIDGATAAWLTSYFDSATTDSAVRAIVVTGTQRDFCTGADVVAPGGNARRSAERSPLEYRYATEPFRRLFQALWEVEKPVVSAVNGTVAGAGWMLALLADLVVASTEARWTHVFARRGMVPHAGDAYYLPRVIPFHRLNEIALLSDPVSSETLHQWGVVNRAVAPDEVMAIALELAHRLANGPTRTLGMTKRLYRRSLSSDMETVFEAERNATALISTTADREEGVRAFVEGRAARFTGE